MYVMREHNIKSFTKILHSFLFLFTLYIQTLSFYSLYSNSFKTIFQNMKTFGEYKVVGNKIGSGAFG